MNRFKQKKIVGIVAILALVIALIVCISNLDFGRKDYTSNISDAFNGVTSDKNTENDSGTDTSDSADNENDSLENKDSGKGDKDSKDSDSGDSDDSDDSDSGNDNSGNKNNDKDNNNNNNDDKDDDSDDEGKITVYISIDATRLADGEALRANNNENKQQYVGDGHIADNLPVKVDEGASVYDALVAFCNKYGIHLDASGTSLGTAYIRGINHLYEFDGGTTSGWVYLVNDVYAVRGASSVFLNDGDKVLWFYTLTLGNDAPGNE